MPTGALSAPPQLRGGRYVAVGGGRLLGEGSFGSVWEYVVPEAGGKRVAVKRIRLGLASISASEAELLRAYLGTELVNHAKLRHPNVITLWDAFVSADEAGPHLNLVLEPVADGTLIAHVNRQPAAAWSEADARPFFRTLLLALDHLHTSGVVHRDIKLENTLLHWPDGVGMGQPQLMVADLGLSCTCSRAHTRVGSAEYIAPEVVLHGLPVAWKEAPGAVAGAAHSHYEPKRADMFSAGVLLFALVCLRYPFPKELTAIQRLARIRAKRYDFPDHVSEPCRELLAQLLDADPAQRPSTQEALAHPWVQQGLPAELPDAQEDLPAPCLLSPAELQEVAAQAIDILNGAGAPLAAPGLNGRGGARAPTCEAAPCWRAMADGGDCTRVCEG